MGRRAARRCVRCGVAEDIRDWRVVRTAGDVRLRSVRAGCAELRFLLVEAHGDPAAIVGGVKRRIAEMDPALPVLNVSSVAAHMQLLRGASELVDRARDACLAVMLGAVGVHGVVSRHGGRRRSGSGSCSVPGAPSCCACCSAEAWGWQRRERRWQSPAAPRPAGCSETNCTGWIRPIRGATWPARSSAWGPRSQRTSCPHGGRRGGDPAVALRDE